jgi:EAL domain-containing protein (putative c-di-GMP-specific phosphodiesterase class I)
MKDPRNGTLWEDDLEAFAEALGRALVVPELFVHYQPRFSLKTGEMCGTEALVRWDCPRHGRLLAGAWVHLAAKVGAIGQVDELVLDHVCRQLGEWESRAAIPAGFWVAVNIAGPDLANPGFPDQVAATIKRHGTRPGRLRFEQVYWTMTPDHAVASKAWKALHELGVGFDLDYLGTGFTSTADLKCEPGRIGIPWDFINPDDKGDAAVVKSMVELSHARGALAVAKGVENATGLDWMKGLGCDEAQGFYLGRPASPGVLELLLNT